MDRDKIARVAERIRGLLPSPGFRDSNLRDSNLPVRASMAPAHDKNQPKEEREKRMDRTLNPVKKRNKGNQYPQLEGLADLLPQRYPMPILPPR